MNCRDFREIADSYLNDELLVETNHDVLRHLEQCANCRQELSARRELREHLRVVVKRYSGSRMDPAFATRLKANLRAKRKKMLWSWSNLPYINPIIPGLAILTLIFAAGITWQPWRIKSVDNVELNPKTPTPANTVKEGVNDSLPVQNASFVKIKSDAVDDHRFCALKFSLEEDPISLKEAAEKFEKYNHDLDLAVIKPLQEVFGDKVKLLEAHSCIVNGRRFAHVVLQYQNRTISVMVTKSEEELSDEANNGDAISCQTADGLRIACFRTAKHCVFVVSDLAETENLKIARVIAPSLSRHIEQV